jgi:hypothetical protein
VLLSENFTLECQDSPLPVMITAIHRSLQPALGRGLRRGSHRLSRLLVVSKPSASSRDLAATEGDLEPHTRAAWCARLADTVTEIDRVDQEIDRFRQKFDRHKEELDRFVQALWKQFEEMCKKQTEEFCKKDERRSEQVDQKAKILENGVSYVAPAMKLGASPCPSPGTTDEEHEERQAATQAQDERQQGAQMSKLGTKTTTRSAKS